MITTCAIFAAAPVGIGVGGPEGVDPPPPPQAAGKIAAAAISARQRARNTAATPREYHRGVAAFDVLLRETLVDMAVLCFPVLSVAALIGTAVAVLQAATQVQEQTLSLLPKLIGVGLSVAVGGAFGMHLCAVLFSHAIAQLAALTQP